MRSHVKIATGHKSHGMKVCTRRGVKAPYILNLGTRPVFRKLSSPTVHPNLSNTHDGTPQNFASRKVGSKLYMAINMLSSYKSLPYESAGIRKQIITHVE
jgi:hypothetical protein